MLNIIPQLAHHQIDTVAAFHVRQPEYMLPRDTVNRLNTGLVLRFMLTVIDRVRLEQREQTVDDDDKIGIILLLLLID